MRAFAERTGLEGARPDKRYLWTDAFALCNFLELSHARRGRDSRALARSLIERVHHVLGRHRADDERSGWLSGLSEVEGALHPTRGGLRIGKTLPERAEDEPFDDQREWDRDGQYLHYLTKWMHALDQAACSTREPRYNSWARELAQKTYEAFLVGPTEHPRLAWKMSVDLSRPLVASTGQHDALDGYITCAELRATALAHAWTAEGPSLEHEIHGFERMLEVDRLFTLDPLGLGGLLMDACRADQLALRGGLPNDDLAVTLCAVALEGLHHYARAGELAARAERRLAFRELGLCIGLAAVERMTWDRRGALGRPNARALRDALAPYAALRAKIEAFWLTDAHRTTRLWLEHRDINDVMLATALEPDGMLVLRS